MGQVLISIRKVDACNNIVVHNLIFIAAITHTYKRFYYTRQGMLVAIV